MNEKDDTQHSRIDAGRPRGGVFDHDKGYSGQDYNREDAERQEREDPSGRVDPDATGTGDIIAAGDNDLPENGRRASVDPATGEVGGSGSGNGGGKMGEDYASDPVAGSDDGQHVALLGRVGDRK